MLEKISKLRFLSENKTSFHNKVRIRPACNIILIQPYSIKYIYIKLGMQVFIYLPCDHGRYY